jgi:hypothetical protein
MPTNNDIPQCALSGTLELIDDTDSSDDSPSDQDGKLSEMENKMEIAEYRKVATSQITLMTMPMGHFQMTTFPSHLYAIPTTNPVHL